MMDVTRFLVKSSTAAVFALLVIAVSFSDMTYARALCGCSRHRRPTTGNDHDEAGIETPPTREETLVDRGDTEVEADGVRPWEINLGLCPPPLAHLCTINVPGPTGGTQQAFVTPFFEGDIVLDPVTRRNLGHSSMQQRASLAHRGSVTRRGRTPGRHRRIRAAVQPVIRRWPDGIIPYIINDDFAPETAKLIRTALRHWERQTCIEFREKKPRDTDYLRFAYYPGCWSFVGRQGGEQLISMGPGCAVFGTIVHEVGHAVGFWHEQSRRDRDRYVKIVYRNIVPGTEDNFGVIDPANVTSMGFPYDYESIMHYAPNAFTATGGSTIKIKKIGRKYDFLMGQQVGLSPLDVAQVRAMYGCNQKKMAEDSLEECTQSKNGDGREYRGNRDYTVSGATCQKWSLQWPHKQEYWKDDPARNEKQGLGDHNYCRNPSGKRDKPWCYTTLRKTRWEYCDVQICETQT